MSSRLIRPLIATALTALLVVFAGCGGGSGRGSGKRFSDKKITAALGLKASEGGLAVQGDPFCEVDPELLNGETEVDAAKGDDDLGLIVTNPAGDAGVLGIAPFQKECRREASRGLRKLRG